MFVRICSHARPGQNIAYDAMNGIFPASARPALRAASSCCWTPISMYRSGYAFANGSIRVDSVRSAQIATMRWSFRAAATRPSPNPSRVGRFGNLPPSSSAAFNWRSAEPSFARPTTFLLMFRAYLAAERTEFFERDLTLLRGRRLTVPAIIAFHEVDAVAGDRVGDDDGRLLVDRLHFMKGVDDAPHVVAVDVDDVPTEGLVFHSERFERHHALRRSVDLDIVAIDDAREVVQTVLAREHRRFPMQACFVFRVRGQAVSAPRGAIHSSGIRNPARLREARAKRAGRRFEAEQAIALRVTLKPASELAQRHELVDGKVTGARHRRVPHGADMAIREDETVAIRPHRFLRPMVEYVEV